MKSNVDLYLGAISDELICGKKRRKALIRQFSADIEAFSDECGGELTMKDLERRFGTASEVADILLKQTDTSEVKRLVSKKKIVIACVTVTCIAVIVGFLCYFAHDIWRKEDFYSGYESETVVFNEQEIPEHEVNPPENMRKY